MHSIGVNIQKVIACSIAIIILQIVVFSILWSNPFVKQILAPYATDPAIKGYDFIGGEQNWKLIRLLFHVGFMSLCIYVYIVFLPAIPGNFVLKGVYFGSLIGFLGLYPKLLIFGHL